MSAEHKNSTAQTNPPRIGFAISTRERTDLTRQVLPALDCGGFDLIWCDGSKTPEGRAFASREHFKQTPLIEINHDVTGGPDAAIQFSLKRLLALGYDYVGLIENDITLQPGWLEAMMAAWRAAEKDGFNVGAVTARTAASRVLSRTENYSVQWNLGAGMSLFSRAGAEAVLADYQVTNAKTIHEFFRANFAVDLSDAWELFMHQPDRGLGADWHYAASMMKHGLVALGVVPNMAQNIDVDFEKVCGTRFLRTAQQVLLPHVISTQSLQLALKKMTAPADVEPAKPKVAEDLCKGKNLTAVQKNSEFERDLRALISKIKPRFIVETGTYLGQGTTRIIASALKDAGLTDARFFSCECNPEHHRQALENLTNSGLINLVRPLHGVSVPRSLLPDETAIRTETIDKIGGNVFVDHHEENRIKLYLNETNYPAIAEDLLGACLRECGGKPDLLLLDSAGHMGNVEFNYVLNLLRAPCYLALDDIRHVKHARSIEQMKDDPRFEYVSVTEEKFGSCIVKFTPNPADLPQNEVQRILFVRTDSIGDAVLASSLLDPLRRRHPHARIAVLCQAHVAELFTACPFVDGVISYDQKNFDAAKRASLLAEITEFNPEIILNSVRSRDHFSNELTQLFPNAKHIAIAGDRDNISEADQAKTLAGYEEIIPTADKAMPELARHGDFLRGLDIGTRGLQPAVWTTPEDEALAEAFFKQEKLDPKKTIALFPFTQHAIKDYPHFGEALLEFAGWNILMFGGAESEGRCDELAKKLFGNIFNLAGKTSLREMAALIRRCRVFVGSDSSGAHIACAVGTPNVVVLGGGHFGRFLPYSPLTSAVSLPLNCFGCNWRCQHAHAHCIKDLAPDTVTSAIQQSLQKPSTKPRIFISPATNGAGNAKWQLPDLRLLGVDAQIVETGSIARAFPNSLPVLPPPPTNHERVPCPSCGGREAARVRQCADIVQCHTCETVYLRTRFTREAMRKLYQSYANEGSHMALPKSLAEAENSGLKRDYFLKEILEFVKPEGGFMDVGCGWGAFLLNARSKGFNPRGIELTKACVSYANTSLSIPVTDTQLDEIDITPGSLRVVTMNHVFEHLPDPSGALKKVIASLEPGGVFCGIVPNFASVCSEVLGETWYWLDPNYHYQHFTPATMRKILEDAGFVVERIYTATGDYGPDAVRKACLKRDEKCENDDYFAAELKRYETNGRGEEIRFFARKPATPVVATNNVAHEEAVLLIPEIATGPEPIVTIVVSTYKSMKFIRDCLENLTRQTIFHKTEIIVVDSGSPENERGIVEEFQQTYANIRYVRTPRETLYAAWNRALNLARGRYFANVNTDDSLRNNAIETLVASLEKHSDCALAYADVAWATKPNDTFPSANIVRTVKYPHYAPVETLFYCITGCLQFFRTESLRKVGGFDAALQCAGDYEATLKLMAARMNAVHVPEVLSLFFQNTTGLTQASDRADREHEVVMNRYRGALDITKILDVSRCGPADAWGALGQHAERFFVPWEDKPMEHLDFATACYHHALHIDPNNEFAGMSLAALHHRLNRLNSLAPALVQSWPQMQQWIPRAASGEVPVRPEVPHAILGPVFSLEKNALRPTEQQLAAEPATLRPLIARIEGRHVYLSEDIFPRPTGFKFTQAELQEATNRLISMLRDLPPFQAHFGGAGDLLVLLASFYDDKPESVLFSYPNSIGATQAMLEAFPKLSKIYFLPQHVDGFFHVMLRRLAYEMNSCLGAGATPHHGYEEEWIPGLDLAKKYGVKMNPRWAAALKNNSGSKKIAVAPRGSLTGMVGSKKNIILPEIWPQVIGHIIERGFEPVIIGLASEAKEYPALPGCTDARHESFAGQMKIVGECAGLVGADSWAKSFSALAEIPTIVFEPIKGAELAGWKDPSDWVFIEPWKSLTMVKTLAQFRRGFDTRIAKRGQPQKVSVPKISWSGSFLDYGSLSHINRELAVRLEKNVPLTRIGQNGIALKLKQDKALVDCARKISAVAPANTAITVRHQWPPDWSRPANGALVVIQPWEFGSLPQAWLDNAENVDEFWVPSPLVRHMYVDSGIAPEKVQVVPNGVDTQKFRPGLKPLKLATKKKFKFLFVGGTIHRKGPDVLLEAFSKAFTAADDVCLVVKDFGGDTCYRGQTAAEAIRALQQKPGAPEIVYLDQEISSDDMPGLYAACDCFVMPYRGEGFGMPVLEAMACGLPVVVTAQGATDSFVTKEAGWKIPSRIQRLNGRVGEIPLVKSGWLLEPNLGQLTHILKIAAANPAECRQRGASGRGIVERRFDWNHIAAIVQWRLGVISEKLSESATTSTPHSEIVRLTAPDVAQIGDLKNARALLTEKNFEAAWTETEQAVFKRPFHPAGVLMLAEIAKAAGADATAKRLAQQAQQLVPRWDAPKKFLNQKFCGDAKPAWMKDISRITHHTSPRLSVCLITKNEEKFLKGCLASIRDLATQIVVVDTGSTDRTVEIAQEFGAEVHSFPWCDDFAAARNAALAHASGDWILMLDADEELPAAQHARIRKHMSDATALGFRLPLVNVGQENEGRSFVPRLFRNAPGVFFHGRIHEQVFPSLLPLCKTWNMATALGEAELKHHGYTKELIRDRNKIERNLKLLRLGLLETPQDANLVMNFGMELVRSGDLQTGLTKYREAFALMLAQPASSVVPELREALLSQFATHLYKVRGHDEVVRILNSPLAKNGGLTSSLHFALGLSLFELKNFVGSAEQMRQCLAKKDQPALTPINVDIHSGAPWHCRALCFSRLEEKAEAEKCFTAAVNAGSRANEARIDFAKFLADQNRGLEALQQLHPVVETDKQCLVAWKIGGQIALSRNEFLDFAQDWTVEAIQYFPGDVAVQAQRAEALLLAGKTMEALPLWRAVREKDGLPRSIAALLICSVCESEKISTPGSAAEEEQISRVFIGWYQRLLGAGAHAVVSAVNSHFEKISMSLPTAGKMLRAAFTEAAQLNAEAIP